MNIVLRPPINQSDIIFYIVYIRREGNSFVCGAKKVAADGTFLGYCEQTTAATEVEAKNLAKLRAKTKMKKRNYVKVLDVELPQCVYKWLEPPVDKQISPEEMYALIQTARKERYVVFANVKGMEDYFDEGIEYLAEETGDFLLVYDRTGIKRECFHDRMASINLTETASEAKGILE